MLRLIPRLLKRKLEQIRIRTMDDVKAGWKTTEFWLSLLAVVVAYIGTADLWEDGTVGAKAIAVVATVLAALGYSASRAVVKSSANNKQGDG